MIASGLGSGGIFLMLSVESYEFQAGFLSCRLGFYYSFYFDFFCGVCVCFESVFSIGGSLI